ncbi:hypothetical protein GF337_16810 [candidate division KSB1 bacterium]|nr:hypothetical protein [candidate division KSB1 bacterium]
MKQKIAGIAIFAILIVLTISTISDAQIRRKPRRPKRLANRSIKQAPTIGLRIGNDFENEQYLLGGQLWMPVGRFWSIAPNFEYYFVDEDYNYSRWQFNGDLIFKPAPRRPLHFGGGLAVNYLTPNEGDSETEMGGNVFVGLDFSGVRKASMYPYIQARWTFLEDDNYFSLLGGINLVLR